MSIFVPAFPLFPVSDGQNYIKVTNVVSVLFGSFLILWLMMNTKKSSLLFLMYFAPFLLLYLFVNFSLQSIAFFVSLLSIFLSVFWYTYYLDKKKLFQIVNFLVFYAITNLFLSLLSSGLGGFSYLGWSFDYGFLKQPYIYSFYLGIALILSSIFYKGWLRYIVVLLLLFGLVESNSRSIAYLLFSVFVLYWFLVKPKTLIFGLFIVPFLLAILPQKMLVNNLFNFSTDPSMIMRLTNIGNYIEWLNPIRFWIGGGVRSFLEFSIAYGRPGPLDNLYFRVLAESGVIGLFSFLFGMFFMFLYLIRIFKFKEKYLGVFSVARLKYMVFLTYLFLVILVVSFFQESLLVAGAGHLITFFIFSTVYFNFKKT